jgi:hypothetical protein
VAVSFEDTVREAAHRRVAAEEEREQQYQQAGEYYRYRVRIMQDTAWVYLANEVEIESVQAPGTGCGWLVRLRDAWTPSKASARVLEEVTAVVSAYTVERCAEQVIAPDGETLAEWRAGQA